MPHPRDLGSHALLAMLACSLSLGGCGGPEDPSFKSRKQDLPPIKIVLSERAGKVREYPCQDCHNKIEAGDTAAAKKKHRGLRFDHFQGISNCFTCHDKENRNAFSLMTGEKVAFNDSHLVCGQCHMEKLADWKTGAHGKHIGGWRGVKHRETCADCHHPHSPAIAPVEALPGPKMPKFGIAKGEH